jgi:hypothetical protein
MRLTNTRIEIDCTSTRSISLTGWLKISLRKVLSHRWESVEKLRHLYSWSKQSNQSDRNLSPPLSNLSGLCSTSCDKRQSWKLNWSGEIVKDFSWINEFWSMWYFFWDPTIYLLKSLFHCHESYSNILTHKIQKWNCDRTLRFPYLEYSLIHFILLHYVHFVPWSFPL